MSCQLPPSEDEQVPVKLLLKEHDDIEISGDTNDGSGELTRGKGFCLIIKAIE
jgi:hypothetical protein